MTTMRAVVFNGADKPLSINQLDIPQPIGNEVLLKIHRCGICGSDISMTSGSHFDYAVGRRVGHEYSGEVVDTGPAVSQLKIGDRVTCLPNGFCGSCDTCKQGRPLFCTAGKPLFGGMADYITAPETSLIALPQSLSFADGALVEPMACGRRALRSAQFQKGSRLLVLGAGAMALSAIYWGRLLGAGDITVLSRSAHRREIVMNMGADRYLCHEQDDPEVIQQLATQPYDMVAECVGKSGIINSAMNYVRPMGTVISMGMCMCDEVFVPAVGNFKEVKILFPLGYSLGDFQQTVNAFEANCLSPNSIAPETMVSDTISLEQVPEMFEQLRAGSKNLKVMVDPQR